MPCRLIIALPFFSSVTVGILHVPSTCMITISTFSSTVVLYFFTYIIWNYLSYHANQTIRVHLLPIVVAVYQCIFSSFNLIYMIFAIFVCWDHTIYFYYLVLWDPFSNVLGKTTYNFLSFLQ